MNILILGKGGREQAIVKALTEAPSTRELFVLPGGAGFAPKALCLSHHLLEKQKLTELIKKKNIHLVVIGPEKELAEGWSDFFRSLNVPVFGPSKSATRLEASKLFAKRFMISAGIPTAKFKEVTDKKSALNTALSFGFPAVLKADGLAGGKGVFICHNKQELEQSADLLFEKKIFGPAGEKALVEEFQKGEELSVFILTNGTEYKLLPFAKDYKKLKDGGRGPNTGGMGAFAPYEIRPDLQKNIEENIIQPCIREMKKRGLFYRGVLYTGLMIVDNSPVVLEYNARFGDPETQVLLPLLCHTKQQKEADWAKVFLSVAEGRLPDLHWKKSFYSACVVLAAENYPSKPVTGIPIEGDTNFESSHSYFLHAGTTKSSKGAWLTNGGRVLNAVGLGETKATALRRAYEQAEKARWTGKQMRSDIGS